MNTKTETKLITDGDAVVLDNGKKKITGTVSLPPTVYSSTMFGETLQIPIETTVKSGTHGTYTIRNKNGDLAQYQGRLYPA